MAIDIEQFNWAKTFIGFTDADAENLASLSELVAEKGPGITDQFYAVLQATAETASKVEGRVDALKKTHKRYLGELVAGDYGEGYFRSRVKIGEVHVAQGIEPHWVEAVMSIIRAQLIALVATHESDPEARAAKCRSVISICDLDLLLINFAYAEERLDRLTNFTGMSRRLLENVINMPPKSKAKG